MAQISLSPAAAALARGPARQRKIRVFTMLGIWATWEIVAYSGLLFEGVVPSSLAIFVALFSELFRGNFYLHLGITLGEVFSGFIIAAFIGIGLGIWMGARRFFGKAVDLYIGSLGATPKIIFLPIVMIFFGVGPESKTVMAVIAGFFPIAINTYVGMLEIPPVMIKVGKSFNLTRWQMVQKIYVPSLYRPIVVGMRLGLGGCFIISVLSEAKIANHGIGNLAIDYYNNYQMAEMYALLVLIFVMAGASNYGLSRLANRSRA
ncbi:MAG: ABC transporter permease [Proteobacteria bacterium]|nr:ABC transporter permease [Pseudomonadota bacterium]